MKPKRLAVLEQISKEALTVLEVGSYEGASALHWHRWGCSVTCIDPWKPYPSAPEKMREDLESGLVFRRFLSNTNGTGIKAFRGNLADYVRTTFPETKEFFDVVFIDGDHTHEAVLNDLRLGSACLKDGGIICGDDYEDDYPGVISAAKEFFDREVWNKHSVFAMRKDEAYGWVSID